jgi:hypothetical protein
MAPTVMISGVGLLLLSMTNRLGRPLDRIRLLITELRSAPEGQREVIAKEIRVLYRRAGLLQAAIVLATISITLAAMIIVALFLGGAMGFMLDGWVEFLFSGSLVALVASLVIFIVDIRLGLHSIKIELERWGI